VQQRYELVSLAKYHFRPWAYVVTLLLFIASLQATNIASIIECAQVMDETLVAIFDYTGAVEVWPSIGWAHTGVVDPRPFSSIYGISLGFIIVMLVTIPLGYFNLDDNQIVQEGAVIAMFLIVIEWIVSFFLRPWDWSNVPAFGSLLLLRTHCCSAYLPFYERNMCRLGPVAGAGHGHFQLCLRRDGAILGEREATRRQRQRRTLVLHDRRHSHLHRHGAARSAGLPHRSDARHSRRHQCAVRSVLPPTVTAQRSAVSALCWLLMNASTR
jgi:hypothetical protein